MSDHLTDTQISRYVERRGDADEILLAAAHLDGCWECRDRTAALVDDGASDRAHRPGAHDDGRARDAEVASPYRFVPWLILIAIAIVALAIALLAQK